MAQTLPLESQKTEDILSYGSPDPSSLRHCRVSPLWVSHLKRPEARVEIHKAPSISSDIEVMCSPSNSPVSTKLSESLSYSRRPSELPAKILSDALLNTVKARGSLSPPAFFRKL